MLNEPPSLHTAPHTHSASPEHKLTETLAYQMKSPRTTSASHTDAAKRHGTILPETLVCHVFAVLQMNSLVVKMKRQSCTQSKDVEGPWRSLEALHACMEQTIPALHSQRNNACLCLMTHVLRWCAVQVLHLTCSPSGCIASADCAGKGLHRG